MVMTMRVYEVDSRTGTVIRERVDVTVQPGSGTSPPPMLSSAYPPCRCPRCRPRSKN